MRKGQQEEKRTFRNYLNYGHVFGLLVMYLMLAPVISFIVSSLVLFIILTFLFCIQLYIGWQVWRSGVDIQDQQRLMGFFLIFNLGLNMVMPFFFLSFGSIFFYISLSIYLAILGFLFTKTKVIANGIHNPSNTVIGKMFFYTAIVIAMIAIPAGFMASEEMFIHLMDEKIVYFYVFTSLYLLGLFLTFLLPVFIYPVQSTVEELPKGRKKLSRAKRKELKSKKLKVHKH